MDSIRSALGPQQISYYGFSYGTYLGQVYTTLFPSHVRRMVLDSNVDPRKVWYQANLDQDSRLQTQHQDLVRLAGPVPLFYHLGTTEKAVENLLYADMPDLNPHPAGGVVGPDEWTDVFL